jgi:hypothetical protein
LRGKYSPSKWYSKKCFYYLFICFQNFTIYFFAFLFFQTRNFVNPKKLFTTLRETLAMTAEAISCCYQCKVHNVTAGAVGFLFHISSLLNYLFFLLFFNTHTTYGVSSSHCLLLLFLFAVAFVLSGCYCDEWSGSNNAGGITQEQ